MPSYEFKCPECSERVMLRIPHAELARHKANPPLCRGHGRRVVRMEYQFPAPRGYVR